MIGPSGFMQAPKGEPESVAYKAGRDARERGVKLTNSALKNLHPGSQQYADFIAGFDSKIKKVSA